MYTYTLAAPLCRRLRARANRMPWLALGSVLSAGLLLAAPRASSAGPLSGLQLVQLLRAGGCVLVMRHAQAPSTLPDASTADPGNPGHERQLDPAGKASARTLGAALRALSIPVGPIYSSPTYRALETIRLARFSVPKIVEQLAESGQGMMGAADRANGRWLRQAVERQPPPGSNTLIVTHTPNIVGAFGRDVADIRPAEMIVFELKTRGRAQLLGRITVEEWQQLARQR